MTCATCNTSEGVAHVRAVGRWLCGACIDRMLALVGWITIDGALHTVGRCEKYHAGMGCEPVYRLNPGRRSS